MAKRKSGYGTLIALAAFGIGALIVVSILMPKPAQAQSAAQAQTQNIAPGGTSGNIVYSPGTGTRGTTITPV